MKITMNLANKNGYIFYNGKLQWFEFVEAIVDFNRGLVQYTCKLGGELCTLMMSECPEVYESEEHYKSKSPLTLATIEWTGALGRVFNASTRKDMNESGECKLWQVENNVPIEVDAPKANFLYKNGKWRLEIQYVGKGKFFNSREQAQMYCDLIIVEEDGTERIEKSAASRMLLNDEQKEAIQAIKTAIEDANKKGVILLFDRDCDDIYAFSKKEMEKWEIDCRDYRNTESRVDCTDLLEDVGMNMYSTNLCDCGIYVEWKK